MIAFDTVMGAIAITRGISVDWTKEYSPFSVCMLCDLQSLIIFGMLNYTSSLRLSMRMTYDIKKPFPLLDIVNT